MFQGPSLSPPYFSLHSRPYVLLSCPTVLNTVCTLKTTRFLTPARPLSSQELYIHQPTSLFSEMINRLNMSKSKLPICEVKVAQSYTVHGILQARMLEWVAFPFSRGSSQPRSPPLQGDSLPTEPPGSLNPRSASPKPALSLLSLPYLTL